MDQYIWWKKYETEQNSKYVFQGQYIKAEKMWFKGLDPYRHGGRTEMHINTTLVYSHGRCKIGFQEPMKTGDVRQGPAMRPRESQLSEAVKVMPNLQ